MITGKDLKNKGITIKLDKQRHLLFDLNAFCELEEKFGNIQNAFEALDKGSMKGIRALLYAALAYEDDILTEKQVGQFITMENIGEVSNKISEALGNSIPETENKDIEDIEKEKN